MAKDKTASYKVTWLTYLRSNDTDRGEANERWFEKELAREVGNREIIFISRNDGGKFLIITREAN